MIKKYLVLFSGLVLFLSGRCMAETVSMPLTVDYPMLRTLVASQAFAEPGETATILDEEDGCNRVTLSQPAFREENALVRFESRMHIRLGTPMGENCLMPIEWEGYLVFNQRPRIDPANWSLSFETLDSKVYDLNRQPANLAQTVLEMISTDAFAYMNGIRVDLAPPVSELKLVFGQFFQPEARERSMRMLQSIRPGQAHANPDAVGIDILMDVEKAPAEEEEQKREAIPDEKLASFFDQWEAWDEFLANMLSTLAPESLSSEERQILLDTLLGTRHRFIAGLTNQTLENDFVREQFTAAWRQLSPVFRHHLANRPSTALLGYLAFFTASDALNALDTIGPALGIEISRNGLVRLVRLLKDPLRDGEPNDLAYRPGLNMPLRNALGLGPPPPALGPAFDGDALDLESHQESRAEMRSLAGLIGAFFCEPAWARQNNPADALTEIKTWLFSGDDLDTYVDRVRSVLMDAARDTLNQRKTSHEYKELFPLLVMSTAWQESCFRQFLVKNKKVVYLRSYNGSSVGLMQINERVWRGMYDPQHLRWDIRYNALAGCEILDLYATKYLAARDKKNKTLLKAKDETRAGVIYAMYNGGPGQLDAFLSRSAKGNFFDSDTLFLEKYVWVKNGKLANISKCLIGQ